MIKFTDFSYFLLLSVLVLAYYKTTVTKRWVLLLCASIAFNLSWSGIYSIVWLGLVALCYFSGKFLGNPAKTKKQKKFVLTASVTVALLPLIFFKYLLPSGYSFSTLSLNWLAPIGISYYTFLIIGYLTDVNRKYIKPEMHAGYLALYLGFFPTLLAGPLERARQLLPQLKNPVAYNPDNIKAGIYFIIWGLFKKVVLAARLGDHTNPVFDAPESYTEISVLIAILLFSVQLYCDFSGYCDIATGTARFFGIRLSKNFANRYYFTPSRTESWNSWNITVTSWFRDYVFFNISKGVKNQKRLEFNRLITFVITGLWHGASWSFVIWGFLQWAYVNFEIRTKKFWQHTYSSVGFTIGSPAHNVLRIIVRLLTGTLIMGWFRAAGLGSGIRLYSSMFGFSSGSASLLHLPFFLTILLFLVMDFFNYKMGEDEDIASYFMKKNLIWRRTSVLILIQLVLVFGRTDVANFYYIQF